jgi:cAMP-dependent protein kinase regulator
MFERPCEPDEIIIKEGDNGNYFYIILKGVFDIYIKNASKPPASSESSDENDEFKEFGHKVTEYRDKGFFGELALLYNQPRSATIISKQKGTQIKINRLDSSILVFCFVF